LRDRVVQVAYEMLCKKLGKIIEKLGRLFELQTKHLPLGKNMIKFGHDGLQMSYWKTCWKGYDGVDVLRWNLEVEPIVT
jgi:hypothetical protein